MTRVHPAHGAKSFFDGQLGGFNANSPAWANNWAGFANNDMELLFEFINPVTISSVALNILVETENVIFPPNSFEIWGGATKDKMQLIKTFKPEQPTKEIKPYITLIENIFKPHNVSYLKVIAKNPSKNPKLGST
jgi:hypothetical protein